MKKAKNDHIPRQSLIKKTMIFVRSMLVFFGWVAMCSLVAGVVLTIVIMLQNPTNSRELVKELPTQLVPTAEYLLNHPMPTPEYLSTYEPIVAEHSDYLTQICILRIGEDDMRVTSHFSINGSRLPLLSARVFGVYSKAKPNHACIGIFKLKKGIHLIEFEPSDLQSLPSYQWAIEVK